MLRKIIKLQIPVVPTGTKPIRTEKVNRQALVLVRLHRVNRDVASRIPQLHFTVKRAGEQVMLVRRAPRE